MIRFRQVFFGGKNLQVGLDVKPTHEFGPERIDMIHVMNDTCLARDTLSFSINETYLVDVSP
jgi:hypothetical protein